MIEILRIGHRPERDKRITTHVCLVARAFGADAITIDTPDRSLEKNLASVNRRFGGLFKVRTGVDWRKHMRGFPGTRVHLTMYGMALEDAVLRIPKAAPLLIVVGASKVPASVYRLADFNVSVGNQPHSEVAALALFLDRWFQGKELKRDFGGPVKILPSQRGKSVIDDREEE
jgi:tRNA (cytidine56-2'-O)-methyltransferase